MKKLFVLLLLMLSTNMYGQRDFPADKGNGLEPLPFQGNAAGSFRPGQVFTPNAASLGVYGKIPVNYYTGSADVQIPLGELKGKDCEQPVYISYRTGGHKVSEMPGPFGLGWALHAGGCVNRIINGQKDEMSKEEMAYLTESSPDSIWQEFLETYSFSTPGYIYHPEASQSSGYNFNALFYPHFFDTAPDEFQICADGLSGSFYIGKGGIPMFVSKSPESYKISYETKTIPSPVTLYRVYDCALTVNYFTYISKIIITDSKGVKYTFGGDMSAIDFSYTAMNTPSMSYHHTKEDKKTLVNMSLDEMEEAYWESYPSLSDPRIMATANTWHLVSKEYPMNGEKITFSYEKKGYPIHVSDVNTRFIVFVNDQTLADVTAINPKGDARIWENLSFTDDREQTNNHTMPKTNLSYTILNPSYLTKIESEKTRESIEFTYEDLNGLRYFPDYHDFGQIYHMSGAGGFISAENKYYTVTKIRTRRGTTILRYTRDRTDNLVGGEIDFAFTTDNPLSFLSGKNRPQKMKSPSSQNTPSITPFSSVIHPEENRKYRLHLAKVILCGATSEKREYTLKYNENRLPEFETKVTDHWGYFNGHGYGFLLSTTNNSNVIMSDTFCEQYVDNYFNEVRIATEYGIAESLESITYPTGGRTEFIYEPHQYNKVAEVYPKRITRESGITGGFRIKEIINYPKGKRPEKRCYTYNNSGILNGKPKYGSVGYYAPENSDPVVEQENYIGWASNYKMYSKYRLASEGQLNQIPTTAGGHIAYSHVTEHFADGSSIDYRYTDWEEYPDIPAETYHTFKAKDLMNPFTSCDIMRGLLKEVAYKNANGDVVKREQMTYRDSVCTASAYGDLETGLFSYTNRMIYPSDSPFFYRAKLVYTFFPTPPYFYDNRPYYFRLSRCYIFGKTPYLIQKEETTWNTEAKHPIKITTQYEYNGRGQLISEKTCGSSVTEHRTRWSGDIDHGQYKEMNEAGMIGFPVEETEIVDGVVTSSVLHEYGKTAGNRYQLLSNYLSVSQSGIPYSLFHPFDGDKDASYKCDAEETYLYNADGNVIKSTRRDESSTTIIWGYNGTYPTMVCSAKNPSSIAYYSFDNESNAGRFATSRDEGFHSPGSHVGPFTLTLPKEPGIDVYVVDYMINTPSGWIYKKIEVPAIEKAHTIVEKDCPIDNVRVYPKGEDVVSYTWFPGIGVRSSTDGAGKTASYDYDISGRLKAIYDTDENPVTGYYYHYETRNNR